jgi:hypothetical protein
VEHTKHPDLQRQGKKRGHRVHLAIPGYRGGKTFLAKDCKPPAKKCLCPTVFALYLGITGRKVPKAADKAHGAKVCPFGWNFSKVALWSAWIKAAQERASAVSCSPLVTKKEAEYTDLEYLRLWLCPTWLSVSISLRCGLIQGSSCYWEDDDCLTE